jgi:phenylacetate-CoA ligase
LIKKNEQSSGAVVVTNLLRKRFPVFRYLMGDVGQLNYVNDKRTLLLKARAATSFSVDAEAYFLDDFNWLLDFVDRYQIQIAAKSIVKTDIIFLLIAENQLLKTEIRNKLNQIFDVNAEIITLSLNFVEESALYINNTTSKTPTFVDFRN